jgi:hypothetical protein
MRTPFAVYVLCSLILLVIDAYTPLETVEWMLHVLLVWGVSMTCTPRQLVWAGVLSSVCIAIGSVLMGPRYLPLWVLLTNRAVVMGTIWIIVYYSSKRKFAENRERQAWVALQESQQEVKKLQGLIPICSACKRIRTADGVWHPLEVYIRDNSDADFSHDLCERCIQALYPEFAAGC